MKQESTNGWGLCFFLGFLYLFANIDRFVINLMVEPIKRDFGVSDTEISFLIGIAFSLFYVLFGIPIARLADRSNRKNLLTVGVAAWSVMTALSGVVQNYFQLLLARIGIGIGESTITPCAHSMMSDALPPEKLGRGYAIYQMGSVLGAALAFIVGGGLLGWADQAWPNGIDIPLIGSIYSWQVVFIILGAPGILIAIIFYFTIQEPKRRVHASAENEMSLREVWQYLSQHKRLYGSIYASLSISFIGAGAIAGWLPALLERRYGLGPSESAPFLVLALVLPGIASAFSAGAMGDWLLKRGVFDAHIRLSVIGLVIGFIPFAIAPISSSVIVFATLIAVGYFFVYWNTVLSPVALQLVSPSQMRSTVASLFTVATVLIGFGTGPTFVALITDFVFGDESMIHLSIGIVCCIAFGLGAVILAFGRKPFGELMEQLEQETGNTTDAAD